MHVTISPHLVHLRERFRVAGALVDDAVLAATLAEIEQVNAGQPITMFEALAAAGYLLFARSPADLCVVEVGLGGRFDATNVVAAPAACAITSISLDHQEFLGDRLERIAWEKAGIMKPRAPVATGLQTAAVLAALREEAALVGAPLLARGHDWTIAEAEGGLVFEDIAGRLTLPAPSLRGAHQMDNAGIAVACLRAARLGLSDAAYAGGLAEAYWPGRLQTLHGTLAASLPPGFELILDGGHNTGAGEMLAGELRAWADRPAYLVVGMKQSKDAAGFLAPMLPFAQAVWAVQEPGQHLALPGGSHHRGIGRRGAARARCGGRAGPTGASAARARVDLRQSISGRRGAEARRDHIAVSRPSSSCTRRTPARSARSWCNAAAWECIMKFWIVGVTALLSLISVTPL